MEGELKEIIENNVEIFGEEENYDWDFNVLTLFVINEKLKVFLVFLERFFL